MGIPMNASKRRLAKTIWIVPAAILAVIYCFFWYVSYSAAQRNRGSRKYFYLTVERARKEYAANPNDPVAIRSMVVYSEIAMDKDAEIFYRGKLYIYDPGDRDQAYNLASLLLRKHQPGNFERSRSILRFLSTGKDRIGKRSKEMVAAMDRSENGLPARSVPQ